MANANQRFFDSVDSEKRITLYTVQDVVERPLSEKCSGPTGKMNAIHPTDSNKQAVEVLSGLTKKIRNIVAAEKVVSAKPVESLASEEDLLPSTEGVRASI